MTQTIKNVKIKFKVNVPGLSIEIINKDLKETLSVLQGVSRYIKSVYIKRSLIEREGFGVLNFLTERYPNKRIVFNITDLDKKDDFIVSLIKETKINCFLISSSEHSENFYQLCRFLKKKKKQMIFAGKNFCLKFLQEMQIKELFYFKSENKKNLNYWNKNDLKNIELLKKNNFLVNVGNIVTKDIIKFENISIEEFIVSEEVCYSFNPVEICKKIYSEIKNCYSKDKDK